MSENNSDQPKKKFRLNIADLLPEKFPVQTSQGILYVRTKTPKDWKNFPCETEAENVGKATVQQLCGRSKEKTDYTPLSEEDFVNLNDEDIKLLAIAIAKHNKWGDTQPDLSIMDLGKLAKDAHTREIEEIQKQRERLLKSLESSYSFLQKDSLERLQGQVLNLSALRIGASDAVAEAAQLAKNLDRSHLLSASNEALSKARRTVVQADHRSEFLDVPKIVIPPRPEETPLGRATIESSQNLQVVAERIDRLTEIIAGLNQTVVEDVLPQWFKQVMDSQINAKESADHATESIKWAKLAVYISAGLTIFVTAMTTIWQVHVAYEIDKGNTEQQKAAEKILSDQLNIQKKLIEQQAKSTQELHEALSAIKASATKK